MRESDLFTTVDLFEGTGINFVMTSIIAFAKLLKDKYPSFPGPHLAVGSAAAMVPIVEEIKVVKKERPRSTRIERPPQNKAFCVSLSLYLIFTVF